MEKETEVKGADGELRRSKRTIKPPKRYDKYCIYQIISRPKRKKTANVANSAMFRYFK